MNKLNTNQDSFDSKNTELNKLQDDMLLFDVRLKRLEKHYDDFTKNIQTYLPKGQTGNWFSNLFNSGKRNSDSIKVITDTLDSFSKRLDSLFEEVRILRDKQGKIISLIDNRINPEKKERHGGKIIENQHQDMIKRFKRIISDIDNIITSIELNDNSFKVRCTIKSIISDLFGNDIKLENLIKKLSPFGEFKINQNVETSSSPLEEIYNEITVFKEEIVSLNPKADFHFPQKNTKVVLETEEVISDKCDESANIDFVVYPGYRVGNKVEVKAKVFTIEG